MPHKRLPLAIVGIGCRMPGGVTTPDQLWQLISAGKDGICEVPHDRWDWRRYFSEDPGVPGKIYVRHGGFLQQDIREFDAEFFGISPREARSLDPQQRLLLETTWEAIDDAGLSLDTWINTGGLQNSSWRTTRLASRPASSGSRTSSGQPARVRVHASGTGANQVSARLESVRLKAEATGTRPELGSFRIPVASGFSRKSNLRCR